MKRKARFVVIFLLAAVCSFTGPGKTASKEGDDANEQRKHEEWLWNRLSEAESIKVGMTKADLLKVFGEDGGLINTVYPRFVLRSCHLIKVDVKFEFNKPQRGAAPNLSMDNEMKIIGISKPYLEGMYMD